MRQGLVGSGFGVVAFVVAYIASIVLYANGGMGHARLISAAPSSDDGTKVTIDVDDIQSDDSTLVVNITVLPGPALVDPQTHNLKDDLSVVVTSAVTASKRVWPKGTLPDIFRVSLTLVGDVADWPFDRYQTGPIFAELLSGEAHVTDRARVTMVDRLLGWKVEATAVDTAKPLGPYRVDLVRSPSTVAFGVVILAVLVTLAGLALFVAVQTVRNRRRFQPPMTTWYAAMLFAVMPLRSALPDAPPFGSWIDVTIVLWVIVVLVISMVLYVLCWWRHLKPEPEHTDQAKT
ncbi:MAG: DUF4436 domain-containing protein [Mycobacterium sp.]|uniref:DUF4436 domain-containing protein n=1 Tax=Mycobacterium sp. TaxID=1785 RepID=UPI001ECCDC24|nr:DUF4436 domain-containing protein [Mycobacterium sp.]MBW0019096.1 DUF4436 domain-containing protein [Mycobacterium sp.]